MLRFYMDEDSMRRALARALRAVGFDVLTASQAHRMGFPDSEHLEFAASDRRTIITSNTGDYARLHATWMRSGQHHHGILIVTRQSLTIGEQLRAVQAIDRHFGDTGLDDRIEYMTQWLLRKE